MCAAAEIWVPELSNMQQHIGSSWWLAARGLQEGLVDTLWGQVVGVCRQRRG